MRVAAPSSGAMKTIKEIALTDLRCDQVPDVIEKCDVSLVDNHAGVRPLPLLQVRDRSCQTTPRYVGIYILYIYMK
jgi:hypothetical protein